MSPEPADVEIHRLTPMTFGEHLKRAAAYAFLATLFMAGFGVAAAIWSSSLSPLQTELSRVREERDQVRGELGQVKTEYAVARYKAAEPIRGNSPNPERVSSTPAPIPTPTPRSTSTVTPAPPSSPTPEPNVQEVTVPTGKTREAFAGEVLISLAATAFEGDPYRHTVIASVSSPGYPTIAIDHKDVGYSLEFKTRGKFQILVTAAETFSATFRISRLPK